MKLYFILSLVLFMAPIEAQSYEAQTERNYDVNIIQTALQRRTQGFLLRKKEPIVEEEVLVEDSGDTATDVIGDGIVAVEEEVALEGEELAVHEGEEKEKAVDQETVVEDTVEEVALEGEELGVHEEEEEKAVDQEIVVEDTVEEEEDEGSIFGNLFD
jgi:hypothetical protein